MTTAVVLICYLVTSLFAARVLYGRWREGLKALGGFKYYCRQCHSYATSLASDHETVMRTITAALVWPVTLLVYLVIFRPPPTAAERAATEAKLKARVAELEREAGISP